MEEPGLVRARLDKGFARLRGMRITVTTVCADGYRLAVHGQRPAQQTTPHVDVAEVERNRIKAVSYTHLTLPTIYSV